MIVGYEGWARSSVDAERADSAFSDLCSGHETFISQNSPTGARSSAERTQVALANALLIKRNGQTASGNHISFLSRSLRVRLPVCILRTVEV